MSELLTHYLFVSGLPALCGGLCTMFYYMMRGMLVSPQKASEIKAAIKTARHETVVLQQQNNQLLAGTEKLQRKQLDLELEVRRLKVDHEMCNEVTSQLNSAHDKLSAQCKQTAQLSSSNNELHAQCQVLQDEKQHLQEEKHVLQGKNQQLQTDNQQLQNDNQQLQIDNQQLQNENQRLKTQLAQLESNLNHEQSCNFSLRRQIQELSETNGTLQSQLSIAQNTIQSQSKVLKLNEHTAAQTISSLQGQITSLEQSYHQQMQQTFAHTFAPLQQEINAFKELLHLSVEQNNHQAQDMLHELHELKSLHQILQEQTISLTQALRKGGPIQGLWGEITLERLLDFAGLIKGIHYCSQVLRVDACGRQRRIDVELKLPNHKSILIDSKCALSAFADLILLTEDFPLDKLKSWPRRCFSAVNPNRYAHKTTNSENTIYPQKSINLPTINIQSNVEQSQATVNSSQLKDLSCNLVAMYKAPAPQAFDQAINLATRSNLDIVLSKNSGRVISGIEQSERVSSERKLDREYYALPNIPYQQPCDTKQSTGQLVPINSISTSSIKSGITSPINSSNTYSINSGNSSHINSEGTLATYDSIHHVNKPTAYLAVSANQYSSRLNTSLSTDYKSVDALDIYYKSDVSQSSEVLSNYCDSKTSQSGYCHIGQSIEAQPKSCTLSVSSVQNEPSKLTIQSSYIKTTPKVQFTSSTVFCSDLISTQAHDSSNVSKLNILSESSETTQLMITPVCPTASHKTLEIEVTATNNNNLAQDKQTLQTVPNINKADTVNTTTAKVANTGTVIKDTSLTVNTVTAKEPNQSHRLNNSNSPTNNTNHINEVSKMGRCKPMVFNDSSYDAQICLGSYDCSTETYDKNTFSQGHIQKVYPGTNGSAELICKLYKSASSLRPDDFVDASPFEIFGKKPQYLNNEEREIAIRNTLKRHIHALQKQIDELIERRYQHCNGDLSPDFVLMFVPVDYALTVALQYEPSIYERASRNNIYLVSPSSLLPTLRVVIALWLNAKQSDHLAALANAADTVCEKAQQLAKNFNEIKRAQMRLSKLINNFDQDFTSGEYSLVNLLQNFAYTSTQPNSAFRSVMLNNNATQSDVNNAVSLNASSNASISTISVPISSVPAVLTPVAHSTPLHNSYSVSATVSTSSQLPHTATAAVSLNHANTVSASVPLNASHPSSLANSNSVYTVDAADTANIVDSAHLADLSSPLTTLTTSEPLPYSAPLPYSDTFVPSVTTVPAFQTAIPSKHPAKTNIALNTQVQPTPHSQHQIKSLHQPVLQPQSQAQLQPQPQNQSSVIPRNANQSPYCSNNTW